MPRDQPVETCRRPFKVAVLEPEEGDAGLGGDPGHGEEIGLGARVDGLAGGCVCGRVGGRRGGRIDWLIDGLVYGWRRGFGRGAAGPRAWSGGGLGRGGKSGHERQAGQGRQGGGSAAHSRHDLSLLRFKDDAGP
jgi:hypothetical protein